MKNIVILGATGSIGQNTLKVISLHPDKYKVYAIGANKNYKKMFEFCLIYKPVYAVMSDAKAAQKLQDKLELKSDTIVLSGLESLDKIAADNEVDYVMASIVGSVGMQSALSAIKAGKRVLLANKESLVLAGEIFIKEVKKNNAELIPIDSEHSAIFQSLASGKIQDVEKIELTASGGPFLKTALNSLKNVTPKEAIKHPNWSMGKKISVDSATMINKGLEVIEAHYLFNMPSNKIDVIVHPQSIVHSSVYFKDGSTISQVGIPDMRTAISYGLAYPNRLKSGVDAIDLTSVSPLEFFKPNFKKFRCLKLAYQALEKGNYAIIALNAANEIAVDAFLNNEIAFLDIAKIIEKTLENIKEVNIDSLSNVIENDKLYRQITKEIILKI